jgi:hypothetical protein
VVETVLGMVKLYAFCADKVCIAPELQELGVEICYELTNQKLKQYPLHPTPDLL